MRLADQLPTFFCPLAPLPFPPCSVDGIGSVRERVIVSLYTGVQRVSLFAIATCPKASVLTLNDGASYTQTHVRTFPLLLGNGR